MDLVVMTIKSYGWSVGAEERKGITVDDTKLARMVLRTKLHGKGLRKKGQEDGRDD